MRKLIVGCIALIAIPAMTSAARADCRIMSFVFHMAQHETVSTTGVSTGGSACVTRLRSGTTSFFSSASVVSPPSHGALPQVGTMRITYKPKRGFKGMDRYAVRICGTDRAGTGCAILNYVITVE